MEPNTEKFSLEMRGYTLGELARLYKVCVRTFKRWLKPFDAVVGKKQGRYFTIAQVKIIFEKLGTPDMQPTQTGNV
jgi:hypothetical protein